MKKLLFLTILITSLILNGCGDCGCFEENSDTPMEDMSEIGKILKGKHYLQPLPGSVKYVEISPENTINMFIKFVDKSIVRTFQMNEVEFAETTDKPFVMFTWERYNPRDLSLNNILRYVNTVVLYTPTGTLNVEPVDAKEENGDYVKSLIEGTN